MAKNKKCRRCRQTLSLEKFVDNNGDMNPRGHFCRECHLKRVEEWHRAALKKEKSYIKKLKIVYGVYWRHYAPPEFFHTILKDERDFCPYCGNKFRDVTPNPFNESPIHMDHMDHMDPLDKGGEHSIRNVVLCCGPCNIKKGKRSFQQWLEMLGPEYRDLASTIYGEKHGPPEDFIEGCSTERGTHALEIAIFQTEEELKRKFPQPKVDGPPSG